MSEPEIVRYERRGPAAWLVLSRPEKRNALSLEMIQQLGHGLDRALADDTVRAVVLTGEGRAFCAGADLKAGPGWSGSRGQGTARHPFADLLQRLQAASKPVLAAVNGATFGGGLGLVAAADIAFAAATAKFSFSEVRIGLIPAMISVVVLPKIGPHHARRLFLTGRRFTAEEACAYGLIHQVTSPEALDEAIRSEVSEIAHGGPTAVREAKRLIHTLQTLDTDEAFDRAAHWLAELARTEEAREGMAAFAEKRPPSWAPKP
ncbi:MAG: enoyl-CoA hydratase-related protein [Acidobacteriota bacterium]